MKKLLILILTAMMVFGCSCFVFAADVEDGGRVLYANVNEKLSEMGIPEFLQYDSSKGYALFRIENNGSLPRILLAEFNYSEDSYSYLPAKLNEYIRYVYFSGVDNLKYYVSQAKESDGSVYGDFVPFAGTYIDMLSHSSEHIYYSDLDIYYNDGTSIFFQATPHPQPKILGVAEEIMKEVLTPKPILTMMGGLASLLIVSVLLFLAFRKGWRMLLRVLRRA